MILRVRSPSGATYRVDIQPLDTLTEIQTRALAQLSTGSEAEAYPGTWKWSADPAGNQCFPESSVHLSASALGLRNGDILYFHPTHARPSPSRTQSTSMDLDHVDSLLLQTDGLITRQRDPHFCRHGHNAMCDYCLPLEPYDANFLASQKIKYLSFHSHVRKLASAGLSKNNRESIKSQLLAGKPETGYLLEEPDYGLKECHSHAKYPLGLCSKCQPGPVTLQPQSFRMVDHVEFDSGTLVDDFLRLWRNSGYQSFGFLYGRYEVYEGVPLGLKAVVSAIHTPLQDGSVDGLELLEENDYYVGIEAIADQTASWLGLQKVGMIYTDLTDDQSGSGKVLQVRSASNYFVSCYEVLWMARYQAEHPYHTPWSRTGTFGSRFVTVIVTGDAEGNASLFSYQVSLPAMAMVRSHLVDASTNPALLCARKSDKNLYVPEFFYRKRISDSSEPLAPVSAEQSMADAAVASASPETLYEKSMLCKAEPTFPVDYLLVTLSHGFPSQPTPYLAKPRYGLGFPFTRAYVQSQGQPLSPPFLTAVSKYLQENAPDPTELDQLFTAFTDWGFLMAVTAMDILGTDELSALRAAIQTASMDAFQAFLQSGSWGTIQSLLENVMQDRKERVAETENAWSCRHCTFINAATTQSCEMCGLPQNE